MGKAGLLLQYYSTHNNVNYNTEYHLAEFSLIKNSIMTILNFQYIKDHPYETIKYLDGIQLLKVDARSLDYFYNQIWFFAGALRTYIELTSDLRDEADQLINFIESSYDIAES